MQKIYKDSDASLDAISNLKVGIIGFGNQAKAHALNLYDSGVDVIIGLRRHSSSKSLVEKYGLKFSNIEDVVEQSNLIALLVPDQDMGGIYNSKIRGVIKEGSTLLFAHGYNIVYDIINPPQNINIVMVAPSGGGAELRRQYENGKGIPGLFAIHNDFSGLSRDVCLSYSKAIGMTRVGVFETTFKEETETDLFGEQVLLTGGIPALIKGSYKVLLESGYSPLSAWFVCYYEMKTIVDLFHRKGFEYLNKVISDTAEYGGLTRGKRIINQDVVDEMKKILHEIQSGSFYDEWQLEAKNNYPKLEELRRMDNNSEIEKLSKNILKEIYNSD
tara:strand:+ start:185 stop:1174 length:990 start_codon:yes stop_codon:yes gene_type:complete